MKAKIKQKIVDSQKDYFSTEVSKLWKLIEQHCLANHTDFWYDFYWDEGDYSKVIKYFEDQDIIFGCPTGPEDGGYTSFLVNIETMYE